MFVRDAPAVEEIVPVRVVTVILVPFVLVVLERPLANLASHSVDDDSGGDRAVAYPCRDQPALGIAKGVAALMIGGTPVLDVQGTISANFYILADENQIADAPHGDIEQILTAWRRVVSRAKSILDQLTDPRVDVLNRPAIIPIAINTIVLKIIRVDIIEIDAADSINRDPIVNTAIWLARFDRYALRLVHCRLLYK